MYESGKVWRSIQVSNVSQVIIFLDKPITVGIDKYMSAMAEQQLQYRDSDTSENPGQADWCITVKNLVLKSGHVETRCLRERHLPMYWVVSFQTKSDKTTIIHSQKTRRRL